jgi:hypothetical protein
VCLLLDPRRNPTHHIQKTERSIGTEMDLTDLRDTNMMAKIMTTIMTTTAAATVTAIVEVATITPEAIHHQSRIVMIPILEMETVEVAAVVAAAVAAVTAVVTVVVMIQVILKRTPRWLLRLGDIKINDHIKH